MTLYEFEAILIFILSLLASFGYMTRIIIGIQKRDTNKYRIMLPLFFLSSFGMASIYFLNITGLWILLEQDFETYSRLFVRPYFLFLGSVLFLAAWNHPEIHPIIQKIRRLPWLVWIGLISKKS